MLSCNVGCVMMAWVKSSTTWPLVTFTSIRCGTTHRSTRRTCPLVQSMRATSLGLGAVAGALATDPDAGRSEISLASSPYVRAVPVVVGGAQLAAGHLASGFGIRHGQTVKQRLDRHHAPRPDSIS